MRKSIITLTIIAAALTSCTTTKTVANRAEEASWRAFCTRYGFNPADTSNDEALVLYLDGWRGSCAEDSILATYGVSF